VPIAVRSAVRPLAVAIAAALAFEFLAFPVARAQTPAPGGVRLSDDLERLRATQHAIIMREGLRERRERAEAARRARRAAATGKAGHRARPAGPDDQLALPEGRSGPPVRIPLPAGVSSINAIPTNVPVNNPSGDATSATQAEEGVAIVGNNAVCAWNDGNNFGPTVDAQEAAYSTNGGATWTDIGAPPKPVGGRWASDPLVTVNEKTGVFFFAALIDFNSTLQNGIAMVPGVFSGGSFIWGTPVTVRAGSNSAIAFDKEWLVADSSSGNLYISYTTFGAADTIIFQRSTNGGSTWGTPITINSEPTRFGYVQGSRPCVGPNGEVYVVWSEVGPSTGNGSDYHKIRKSTDHGQSFALENIAVTEFTNFGTGAPGFNRDHGVNFPSIAVDRSTGPHRGRVYVACNESVDWYDDPLPGNTGVVTETESNNTTGTANSFTMGNTINGTISSVTDLDYFKFTATSGKTYIVWCMNPAAGLKYTLRIYCSNGTDRLAYGGDTSQGGLDGFLVWTCPVTGSYYLRMGGITGGGTGGYQLLTAVDTYAGEPGRDMRDAMVSYSDDGITWHPQVRVNDDAALYDNYLSEVGVSCEGYAYSLWYDFRDSPAANCGGIADIYLSRSLDGGATWAASQRVSGVGTNFTTAPSNLQPNEGDYNGLAAGGNMVMAWADGRAADVDVWGTGLTLTPGITCPGDTYIRAGTSGSAGFTIQNANVMFGNTYTGTLTSDQPSWIVAPASQNLTLAASTSGPMSFNITVPGGQAPGPGHFCLSLAAQNGGVCATCCFTVWATTTATGAPPAGRAAFALAGAWPNPAGPHAGFTVSFSLPSDEPATLELVDLNGRRLLSREVGGLGAGSHTLSLQSETAGLSSGVYLLRLSQRGHSVSSKVVLMQ